MIGKFVLGNSRFMCWKRYKKILAHLSRAYPFATNEIEQREQEALGKDNHKIIEKARAAIELGDAEQLGKIMDEAQTLFDAKVAPACPDELNAPILHSVLYDSVIKNLTWGGKGVGSQGDGTVQLLAKDRKSQIRLVEYLNNERKMDAFPFTLNAGGKVRKAIIPIAGLGTRMFPETFFTKKALLPIVDDNDIVKPVLLLMLEELINAEIEEIYIVIGKNEETEYNKIFHFEFDPSYEQCLPQKMRKYYSKIHEVGTKIKFIVQNDKRSLGHAIYQAHRFVKDEPILLMLGDFIYKSNLNISCAQQIIQAYNKSGGKAVVAVKHIPFADSKHYGIVHGKFYEKRPYLMQVDDMVEKPSVEEAMLKLSVDGACYATFGQYILTPDIFSYLAKQIEEFEKKSELDNQLREIDLTSALRDRAINDELVGVDIDGMSYDVGIPEMYYETFCEFGRK